MKVLLVNGSPHPKGCTYTALQEVAETLHQQGIETELYHIGTEPIAGCRGCYSCMKTGKCIISDVVNEFIALADKADGFIFGSPVHYAALSGGMTSFCDRVFFASPSEVFAYKPAAGIVSARRGGTTAAFDQINKYFTIRSMPVVTSQYWNMVHGSNPAEVKQDLEGMQTMRTLGKNMAWLLQSIAAGKAAGIPLPEKEARVATNFIR
ncbi:MAG: flavodoxin family protein [Clostridia bacterium]